MADDLHLALGTMYLGTRQDERASFALLDAYVEAGGTWIDTANCYAFWSDPSGHGGQSEAVIGRWLQANPGMRERVRLSTKVGVEPVDGGGVEGLSAPVIRRGIEASLDRLGTDHVDLYWAHGEDRSVALEETVRAFGEIARDGLALRLGWSNHPTWVMERGQHAASAMDLPGFATAQLRYSYLSPRPDVPVEGSGHPHGMVTREALDYVASNPGWELWAYTAQLSGAYDREDRPLTAAYDHVGTGRRLAVLDEVARETGATRGQVVLAWLIGGTPPVRPVVGGSSVEQLRAAVAGGRLELSPEQQRRLTDAG